LWKKENYLDLFQVCLYIPEAGFLYFQMLLTIISWPRKGEAYEGFGNGGMWVFGVSCL
jgi:hypothetical protein